jgi:hypothetical protein
MPFALRDALRPLPCESRAHPEAQLSHAVPHTAPGASRRRFKPLVSDTRCGCLEDTGSAPDILLPSRARLTSAFTRPTYLCLHAPDIPLPPRARHVDTRPTYLRLHPPTFMVRHAFAFTRPTCLCFHAPDLPLISRARRTFAFMRPTRRYAPDMPSPSRARHIDIHGPTYLCLHAPDMPLPSCAHLPLLLRARRTFAVTRPTRRYAPDILSPSRARHIDFHDPSRSRRCPCYMPLLHLVHAPGTSTRARHTAPCTGSRARHVDTA